MYKIEDIKNSIICGDALEELKKIHPNLIDTIITDVPYGLKFMNKKWDYEIPSIEVFQEMLRVSKPGSTLLCFGGTRSFHRIAVNIEDAGWIIKDCMMWLYGSGFPKSLDISKSLDKRKDWTKVDEFSKKIKKVRESLGLTKQQVFKKCGMKAETFGGNSWFEDGRVPSSGDYKLLKKGLNLDDSFDLLFEQAEREIIGNDKSWGEKGSVPLSGYKEFNITKPTTPEAKLWNGWKSHGLKPAYEPIIIAMKPNEGSYAENALKYGVSGLWIDGGRISHNENLSVKRDGHKLDTNKQGWGFKAVSRDNKGRYPANLLLDEEAGRMLDKQSGVSKGSASSYNFEKGNQKNPERNVTNI